MKNKTLKTLLVGTAMTAALAMGCMGVMASEEPETEAYTGDASLDDTRNQDEIGEKELLVISFGTSFNDNRRLSVGAIEEAMEEAFPGYSVRRGFTSQIIIDHVKDRDGVAIDNVTEALDRAVANGVKTLVVQPTHLMNGIEYEELTQTLAEYADSFEEVQVGAPLLTTKEDFKAVETAIVDWMADYDDGETAIVFMGHGTHAESNEVYAKLQEMLTEDGYTNHFVGTVEAAPTLEDVMAAVEAGEYKKVVLAPLMIVAGDHANNDMAGSEEGAWKKTFEDAGYEVECVLQGMGEIEAIQELLVLHAQEAMNNLSVIDEEVEAYTGDVALDNTRNQDEIGEKELLVISFGTSFNKNRRLTVGAIEEAMEEAFPEYSVRRGFTSQIIIDHVKDRDGVAIDNVTEALDRAVANGVKTLVVQPTHLMNGIEYEELTQTLAEYADSFEAIQVGAPLLTTDEDFKAVETAIVDWTADYDDGETAIVFMGHGTHAESNEVYAKLQEMLTTDGYANHFVGTVEAAPTLEDVMAAVEAGEYKKVVLAPLMIVAGDHANNDMAGSEEGAWKKTFEDAGYEVECILEGMGEIEAIQELLVAHAQEAVDSLAE